jgi:SAM-dependent methyltransferase
VDAPAAAGCNNGGAMTTTLDHYQRHLAPIYLWMCGGADAAFQAGAAEIRALSLPMHDAVVLDLGAGFGMHAIPLARRGARVTAIDTSPELLGLLDELRGETPVHLVHDDLLSFRVHVKDLPDVILCLGDTITHLPDLDAVEMLVDRAGIELRSGGSFVISFRDYTVPLEGDQRFIPVMSDRNRILTCFLEYAPETVTVHDIVHERDAAGWQTRVSHYQKLRLPPEHLITRLRAHRFNVRREAGLRGMVRLVAQKI